MLIMGMVILTIRNHNNNNIETISLTTLLHHQSQPSGGQHQHGQFL
jgi:hypothetical protein